MSASSDSIGTGLPISAMTPAVAGDAAVRRWWRVPLVLVAVYWVAYVLLALPEITMFWRFLVRLVPLAVLLLCFTVWWLVRGPVKLRYRFLVVAWSVVCAIVGTVAMHRTVLGLAIWIWLLPIMFTVWAVWLWLSRTAGERRRLAGMLVIPALCVIPGLLVRMEGLTGSGAGDFHWRWSPTSEEQLVSQHAAVDQPANGQEARPAPLVADAADWTDFRGPQRDATIAGLKIATDWDQHPPRLVWRTRVGPAWSSMIVVGDRLFTQEQRGEDEVVSCFDANTGHEVWAHTEEGRFEESMGGVGPRATPTFADGRIYALGAKGRLVCLDAAAGTLIWSRDIVADASARLPTWGFSGSPLVVDGRVIVFAGGESEQALVAYDAATGDLDWKASAGTESYTSPQLMTLDGVPQVLFVGDKFLGSFDPASGALLWKYETASGFSRPVVQPRRLSDAQVLVSFSPTEGVTVLDVSREGDEWKVVDSLHSSSINPDFSDLVHHDGYFYGFDGNIFCCVNLATGERKWKRGRYGAGQVLLLADQPLLVVETEEGEIVLLAADPEKHQELARFPGISGKTWNHPVISHGKLYVRNAEEMACFELPISD
jgi:outer membrane protein assembly factor BamB